MSTLSNIPMLAVSLEPRYLEKMISSDTYVMEQKLDGHRILLRIQDGLSPLALTRGGNPYTKGLPADLFTGFPVGRWVLDGEWVDGTYWVFDMLEANGMIDEATSLVDRRAVLEAFMSLGVSNPRIRLVPQATTTQEKQHLVDTCRAQGAEGVMVKNTHSTYLPGSRSPDIYKIKFVETADVIVIGVRDDGKDSVRLGAFDGTTLVDVGRASLIGKEKRCPIKLHDVIEVRYLYMGAGDRLYQPTILKVRDDKLPQECTTDQFKHVSKKVLEAL